MNERLNTNNNGNPERGPDLVSPERERQLYPRIYVASLADYVNGYLHGRWIDATQDPDALLAEIKEMLSESKAPAPDEWAIHDYDDFGPVELGEYESLETVSRIATAIVEYGPAFAAWADVVGTESAAKHVDLFEDAFIGEYESIEDYAAEQWDDFGYTKALEQLPEDLRPYIRVDTKMWARDMRLSGSIDYVDAPGGGVYVFWEQ